MELTIKAIPPPGKKEASLSGQVKLDLGCNDLFSIDLNITAENQVSNGTNRAQDNIM